LRIHNLRSLVRKAGVFAVVAGTMFVVSCRTGQWAYFASQNRVEKPGFMSQTLLIVPLQTDGNAVPFERIDEFDYKIFLRDKSIFSREIVIFFRNFPASYQIVNSLPPGDYTVEGISLLWRGVECKSYRFDRIGFTLKKGYAYIFPLDFLLHPRQAFGDQPYPGLELQETNDTVKNTLLKSLSQMYVNFNLWKTD
jgi:hypothetical protein